MRQPGDVVAERYEIEEKLAVGGMGAVYRARHLVSRKPVALKLLHPHLALDEMVARSPRLFGALLILLSLISTAVCAWIVLRRGA